MSRSGSAPTSGSQLPGGITSLLAPSCAPASRICDTSSSSSGTVSSPPSPVASAPTPSTKSRAWLATRSASGCQPSADPASCGPGTGALHIKQPPSFERAPESHLVRVLQVPSDRKPTSRPGHPQPQRLDKPGQVGRGRLSLQVRVRREDQLRDAAVGQPGHEFPGPQVLRADPVDRADRTTQDMVSTAELADLLNGRHVLGLFYHADDRGVAARVPADAAFFFLGHVPADPAEPDPLGHLHEHRGEPPDVRRVRAEQVERDPLRALRPHPWQPSELVDEVLNHSLVHVSPSCLSPSCLHGAGGPGSPPGSSGSAAAPPNSPDRPGISGTPDAPCWPRPAASGPIFSCCSSPTAR